MVLIPVDGVITEWALEFLVENRGSQPPLDLSAVEQSIDMFTQGWGRHGVEPLAGTTGGGEFEVCLVAGV